MSSMIEVKGLEKSFANNKALASVSLDVEEGEMFALLGPDGAGKTTLMRIVCTLLDADRGDASLGGFSVSGEPEKIREIVGYMPQRFSLYGDLTVRENLDFFARLLGVPRRKREERMKELLEFSRLGGFVSRRAEALSGGMKQKLALSCVLIHQPKVLVLDEPTTGVDPVSRREFWRMLEELKSKGTTILVSTPYMNEAERCDRAAMMYAGRILFNGTTDEVRSAFEGEILEVKSGELKRLAARIKEVVPTRFVQILGDRIRVVLPAKYAHIEKDISALLLTEGVGTDGIEKAAPGIEDTFIALMEGRDE
ncbi:MAG: hypothetical protein B6D63_03365 [Candidatus Latescibacteria bacterium 4484_7]|nr:MAG: hypothetical protein B6D63_03365 [Candidatus Latescibacteria bacterium 4484_7]